MDRDNDGIPETLIARDVDGDGKADSFVFFDQYGSWYGALSIGNSFNNYSNWIGGLGKDSIQQFLADVTGDGKDDAIAVFAR